MLKDKKILGFLVAIPVVFWVLVILKYTVNVPWFDDFDPFPDFLHKWILADSFQQKITYLLQPNNEHRMVIGKLVTLLYYQLTGTLNITFIHIAGACMTLTTLAIFWVAFKKTKLNYWLFLPVAFLLFQLQYHLVFLWAICSMQHQAVVLCVVSSMFLLSRNRFGWAIVAAVLANYAMSNGIFVWPAGVVILLLRSNYKQLGIWCLVGAFSVGFYFSGMSAQGNESSIDFLIKNPHLSVLGFFAFLGGLFDLLPERDIVFRSTLPVIIGLITMIWIALWIYNMLTIWVKDSFDKSWARPAFFAQADQKNREQRSFQEFLLGIMIFLLVNALVIGILRPRFGFFVMVVSNYKMYPALFLSIAYLSFVSLSTGSLQQKIFKVGSFVGVLIWVISIFTYLPTIVERKKYLLANAYNQEHNGYGLGHVPFSVSAAYVDNLMKDLTAKKIYQFPDDIDWMVSEIKKMDGAFNETGVSVVEDGDVFKVNDALAKFSYSSEKGEYAFAKNADKVYLFKLAQNVYQGKNLMRLYQNGASVDVPISSLEPGKYQLGLIKIDHQKVSGGVLREITVPSR